MFDIFVPIARENYAVNPQGLVGEIVSINTGGKPKWLFKLLVIIGRWVFSLHDPVSLSALFFYEYYAQIILSGVLWPIWKFSLKCARVFTMRLSIWKPYLDWYCLFEISAFTTNYILYVRKWIAMQHLCLVVLVEFRVLYLHNTHAWMPPELSLWLAC